jgi:hypothetical protein
LSAPNRRWTDTARTYTFPPKGETQTENAIYEISNSRTYTLGEIALAVVLVGVVFAFGVLIGLVAA